MIINYIIQLHGAEYIYQWKYTNRHVIVLIQKL